MKLTLFYATLGLALVFLILIFIARINSRLGHPLNPNAIESIAAVVLLAWLGNCFVTLCMFLFS
jgi:hypothetical protein